MSNDTPRKSRTRPLIDQPEGREYIPVSDHVQQIMWARFDNHGITAIDPDRPGWLMHDITNTWDGYTEVKDNGDGTFTYTSPYTGETDTFGEPEPAPRVARVVTGRQLRKGDFFASGALITNEPQKSKLGVWVVTDDGRKGYVEPNARFNIFHEAGS